MKKLFLFIFATMLVGQALAYDFKSGNLYYTITSSSEPYTVEVASGGTDTVIIPESVNYDGISYAVTGIGNNAFQYGFLTSVTVSNTVTYIGNYAFYGCTGLTTINIPESVTNIGESAFTSLKSVIIPNTVTNINNYAFSGFSRNQKIFCVATSRSNGWSYNWYSGATVVWGAKFIGDFVYRITGSEPYTVEVSSYTGNDSAIVIPEKVTIDEIEYSVTSIGNSAFDCCSDLLSVSIPNTITNIGQYAFYGCSGLKDVNIPVSVTEIGVGAFYNCQGLKSTIVSNSVISIGESAFGNFSNSQKIFCVATSRPNGWNGQWCSGATVIWGAKFVDDFVCRITNSDPCTVEIAGYIGNDTEISVPETVTINNIEYDITSINNLAFVGVRNVIYSGNATGSPWGAICANCVIDGDFAFSDVQKTTLVKYLVNSNYVVIPDGVTQIDINAFSNCSNLISVSFPESIIGIHKDLFKNCPNLQYNVYKNGYYIGSKNNKYFALIKTDEDNVASYDINSTCKVIASYAFCYNHNLKYITIPESVEYVNQYSIDFSNYYGGRRDYEYRKIYCKSDIKPIGWDNEWCKKWNNDAPVVVWGAKFIDDFVCRIIDSTQHTIEICDYLNVQEVMNGILNIPGTITIDNIEYSVTSIGDKAYDNIYTNRHLLVIIPNSVTYIGAYAFKDGYFGTVIIPNSVTRIGGGAFPKDATYYCESQSQPEGWTNYNYDGGQLHWNNNSYSVIWGAKEIDGAIYHIMSDNPQNAEIISSVQSDTALVIPAKVTIDGIDCSVVSICSEAFYRSELRSITIPDGITSIGNNAFSNCSQLKDVTIPKSVTFMGYTVFQNCNITVYCELETQPEGWNSSWFISDGRCKVIWKSSSTAVTDNAANTINIYAIGSTIVIENATEEIRVYNAMGALVGRDAINRVRTEIPVNGTGVYIVKTGGVVKRVVVD